MQSTHHQIFSCNAAACKSLRRRSRVGPLALRKVDWLGQLANGFFSFISKKPHSFIETLQKKKPAPFIYTTFSRINGWSDPPGIIDAILLYMDKVSHLDRTLSKNVIFPDQKQPRRADVIPQNGAQKGDIQNSRRQISYGWRLFVDDFRRKR